MSAQRSFPAASEGRDQDRDRDRARERQLWRAVGRVVAAHVVMLREGEVLDGAAAAAVLTALDGVGRGEPPAAAELALPGLLGLVAAFDDRLEALTAAGAVGASALGRGRQETAAAAARLALRDGLLATTAATAGVRRALLDLADGHVFTLMPAYAEGQAIQPTSLGHLLGGVIAPLGRGAARLRVAYGEVNRSPLGAGALASTGVPIDRERVAALLGGEGAVASAFDAVAALDHVGQAAAAAAAVAAALRRFLGELLAWLRAEPASFRLGEGWTATVDPALPGFRPPLGIGRLVADCRRLEGEAARAVGVAADAGYGPDAAALDDVLGLAGGVLAGVAEVAEGTAALVAGLEPNRAYLANRAGRDHTTSGDLAFFLIGEEGLDPVAAREIALITVRKAVEQGLEAGGIAPPLIDAAALLVVGRELGVEVENLGRWLAPRRYLERRGAVGGGAPGAVRDYLALERSRLLADERWREEAVARLGAADAERERAVAAIVADAE